jgi:hypothetical protein
LLLLVRYYFKSFLLYLRYNSSIINFLFFTVVAALAKVQQSTKSGLFNSNFLPLSKCGFNFHRHSSSESFSLNSSVINPSKVFVTTNALGSIGISPTVPIPSACSDTPPIVSNNEGAFLRSTFTKISVAMVNSVTKSSQIAYSAGWQRWLVFVKLIGTDPYLRILPASWSEWSVAEGSLFGSFPVACAAGFLCYLVNDQSSSSVQPSTAINYLSAVRFNLLTSGVDVRFLDDSIILQKTRTGLMNLWRSAEGNSIADKQTLPLSIDMIFSMRVPNPSLSELACFTAAIFGYHVLCRVSEYLVTPNTKHHILARSVVFRIRSILPVPAVGGSSDEGAEFLHVASSDVHRYPKSSVVGCYLTVKDSKNDPGGEGSRYPYTRELSRHPGSLYDFSEILYDWSVVARPLLSAPFFSTSSNFKLTPCTLNKWLSSIALKFNLDSKRISSHSLRIGGASSLAAAGVNDYVIQRMGRWKSLCFLQYIRLASGAFATAADNLSNSTIFTVDDVRLYNPAV